MRTAKLPVEGAFPALDGAGAWLNSRPLTPQALRGRAVVVQFCTFSCINSAALALDPDDDVPDRD